MRFLFALSLVQMHRWDATVPLVPDRLKNEWVKYVLKIHLKNKKSHRYKTFTSKSYSSGYIF